VSVLPDPESRRYVPALLESPALYRGDADLPAFEVKFLLTEAEAREVEHRLRPCLGIDPHGDPAAGNTYRVTSVYFDTAGFDVYRRSEGYRRRKYRVRRYGASTSVFLEQKTKSNQRVRKRRTPVLDSELSALADSQLNGWAGSWFAERLATRGLLPVCRVTYQRLALVGISAEGPIRLTFDRATNGQPASGPVPEPVTDGAPLLRDEVIAEFKFLGAMPAVFRSVIEAMRLSPRPISKYRRCVESSGIAAAGGKTDV
jgi:hypothetical protein